MSGLNPIVGGVMVHYRKGLSLFERCTLSIDLEAWDARWYHFRFAFFNSRNELSATGFFKSAFISKAGFCTNEEISGLLGFQLREKKMPPAIAL
jgi:hypothetical protein